MISFSIYWLNYLVNCLSKYFLKIICFNNFYYKIILKSFSCLFFVMFFLKKHSLLKFNILTDIACVDFLGYSKRFELNYILLSLFFEFRIVVSFFLEESVVVESLSNIFYGSNWMEREVWDLYGIFFSNHPDLRRILTDYGFDGYPFRKDFPINGFFELRFNDDKKFLTYEPVELTQIVRIFDFINSFKKNSN